MPLKRPSKRCFLVILNSVALLDDFLMFLTQTHICKILLLSPFIEPTLGLKNPVVGARGKASHGVIKSKMGIPLGLFICQGDFITFSL